MGRHPDPARRVATLAQATDYVLANGLAGLSLRPLATALGTSTRMLLYDFGSKEQLISEVLAEARRREAALLAEHLRAVDTSRVDLLRTLWTWLTADERAPYLRLFFEVYVDATTHPGAYADGGRAMVGDWLDIIGSAFRGGPSDGVDTVTATLVIAVIRGLLLDRLAAADPERTDRALAQFAEMLER